MERGLPRRLRLQLICPSIWFSEIVSIPFVKNISSFQKIKSSVWSAPSRALKRGATRSSRVLGAGCDGRFGARDERSSRRMAKACGPDLPTLGSSAAGRIAARGWL